jgi:hypothetical protein
MEPVGTRATPLMLSGLLLVLAPSACSGAGGTSTSEWLSTRPEDLRAQPGWRELPRADVREVQPSALPAALSMLRDSSAVPLGPGRAEQFAANVACSQGTKLFVLRAVRTGAAPGAWTVAVRGADAAVSHGVLGSGGDRQKSALVVCLRACPRRALRRRSTAPPTARSASGKSLRTTWGARSVET